MILITRAPNEMTCSSKLNIPAQPLDILYTDSPLQMTHVSRLFHWPWSMQLCLETGRGARCRIGHDLLGTGIPGNVSKAEGSCAWRRDYTVTGDDREAAVDGGDASKDERVCSGASIGIGAELRNSRFETRWPKSLSVQAIFYMRSIARHTVMMMNIQSLLVADMPGLPNSAALPDGDCPNGKSAETEDSVYKYLRQGQRFRRCERREGMRRITGKAPIGYGVCVWGHGLRKAGIQVGEIC